MPELAPVLAYINNYWPHIIRHHPEDEKTPIGLPHPCRVSSDGNATFTTLYRIYNTMNDHVHSLLRRVLSEE